MKNVFLIAIALVLASAQCFAQQCGSSNGTSQCNLNSRPRAAEPPAVPQAAPASLQSVAADAEWNAPAAEQTVYTQTASLRSEQYDTSSLSSGQLQVQPVGLNLGLVNIGNGRGRDPVGYVEQVQQQVNSQSQQLSDLRRQIIDAQARGQGVTYEEVQRAIAASRPALSPDELYQQMRASPQFQRDLTELLNNQRPEIVRWEIVPTE